MLRRLAFTMAGLSTALPLVVYSSVPAGATARGPAPRPNLIVTPGWAHPRIAPVIITTYTVREGDTLSSVAAHLPGGKRSWPLLWWRNRAIRNPDMLRPGQVLTLPGPADTMTAPMVAAALAALPKPAPPPVRLASDTTPVQPAAAAPAAAPAQVSARGMSSFEQCVISAESGGNPDIWNASGHWGLYQFSSSTWYAAGAAPGTFGNASAAYQEQVFAMAYAKWGTSPWAPSDGC
jgi:hypothetical protein